jgi:hypothetical protein
MQANFTPGPDVIEVPAGTIKLTRPGQDDNAVVGDLDITDSVTIRGRGPALTVIDGNGAVTKDRVFDILPTATNVTMSGMTIRHGLLTAVFSEGGGIRWQSQGQGSLHLSDLVVDHNRSDYAAGIALLYTNESTDTADLNRVTVEHNTAAKAGGGVEAALALEAQFTLRNSHILDNTSYQGTGVYVSSFGTDPFAAAHIMNTEIGGNHSTGHYAGIENDGAVPLNVTDTWIHDNTASAGPGGGIGNSGTLVMTDSTVSGNRASIQGGALFGDAGSTSTLTNVTMSGNSASTGAATYAAVFQTKFAKVVLQNATVGGNVSPPTGSAIAEDTNATTQIEDSIIAKGATGRNCEEQFGGVGNVSDDTTCGFGPGEGVALNLGSLGFRGGPTPTQVPGAGSGAVGAATYPGWPTADQRGIPRPQGTGPDSGAVEVCLTKPASPAVLLPKSKVNTRRPTLDWTDIPCIEGYSVLLRAGSRHGRTVQKAAGLQSSVFRTRTLRRKTTYYWRVTVVGDRGSTATAWHKFKTR